MKLSSPAFEHGGVIPRKYTCDGDDTHPPLVFEDVPEGTQSLALIVDDPDAPMGLWVHWTVWNISPETQSIDEGIIPTGAEQGLTSSGERKYHGPCPPDRGHRYFFRLYALDTKLDLDVLQTGKEELKGSLHGHTIAQADLMGYYARPGQKVSSH